MKKTGTMGLIWTVVMLLLAITVVGSVVMLAIYFLTPADSVAGVTRYVGDKVTEKAAEIAGETGAAATAWVVSGAELMSAVVDGGLSGTGGRYVADYVWDWYYGAPEGS